MDNRGLGLWTWGNTASRKGKLRHSGQSQERLTGAVNRTEVWEEFERKVTVSGAIGPLGQNISLTWNF